ncbi:phosphatase PAP2 family protein [Candidatus Gottesmanbacteria bacterium]|nr:phosphatase PAP2 family protein [Candidatus Gottesmanbacteria bacterium]
MQTLLALDQSLFLFLNHLPHPAWADSLAIALSGVGTAGLVWFVIGVWLFLREEKKDRWFFAPLVLAGAASWLLVEQILKPWAARSRPALEAGAVIVGDGRTDFSFPSGHATIAWAMAVVLSNKEPKWRWIFYLLAILISFSRIYIGKHFPLDVVAGGLLGWGIGRLMVYLVSMKRKKENR